VSAAIAIAYRNLATIGSLTASSSATGWPSSNLKLADLMRGWRSTVATASTIDCDLGAVIGPPHQIDLVALLGVNLTDAADWRVYIDDSAGFGSPEYDSLSLDAFDLTYPSLLPDSHAAGRHLIHLTPTTINEQYVRLVLTDPDIPQGHHQGGVLWIGPVWRPAQTFGYDWRPGDLSVGTNGMEVLVAAHRLTIPSLTAAEIHQLRSIYRALGRTGRMLIVPRPASPEAWQHEVLYCTFVDDLQVQPMMTRDELWAATLHVQEVID